MQINESWLIDRLETLVATDSVNPSLVEGAAGESAVADLVEAWMLELGLRVTRLEEKTGRPSVVGVLPGCGGGRSLMLNGHFDTVGVEGMELPWTPRVEGGRLYGRGSYDMKASVVAALAAVRALSDASVRLKGDLVVAGVADEEYASLGTSEVLNQFVTDGAIVTEPTQLEICLAHKGFVWLEVVTRGRAAHGSQHEQGVDANLHMGRVLGRLEELEGSLKERAHTLLGRPSLHAALLSGGTGISTYSGGCSLKVERRTIPGEETNQVVAEIQDLLDGLASEDESFDARLDVLLVREPFEVDPDAAVVKVLERACGEVTGGPAPHRGENPWMDSALLSGAGIETVVFGPCGGGAHAAEEWVEVASVLKLAAILARCAEQYCGRA